MPAFEAEPLHDEKVQIASKCWQWQRRVKTGQVEIFGGIIDGQFLLRNLAFCLRPRRRRDRKLVDDPGAPGESQCDLKGR